MSAPAAVLGLGVCGAFGAGREALGRALGGQVPRPRLVPLAAEGATAEVPALLCDTGPLEQFLPRRQLRRTDHFSRLALLGAHLALADAGRLEGPRAGMGLVIASGYGATRTTFEFLDSFIAGGDPLASPTQFSHSVHNAAAANVSIALGLTGPCLTVSQFEMSVPAALLSALGWLEEGRAETVLFGAVDEYCDVLGYCRRRFFGAEGPGGPVPLDLVRHTAVPGEGAAFLLLGPGAASDSRPRVGAALGKAPAQLAALPPGGVLLLGADGHRECAAAYSRHVPPGSAVAAYAPLWGSFPAATAFDLAAAVLSAERGEVSPSPSPGGGHGWREIAAAEPLGERPLCCVRLGAEDECGLLTVAREP